MPNAAWWALSTIAISALSLQLIAVGATSPVSDNNSRHALRAGVGHDYGAGRRSRPTCRRAALSDLDSSLVMPNYYTIKQDLEYTPYAYALSALQVYNEGEADVKFAISSECLGDVNSPAHVSLDNFARVPLDGIYKETCMKISGKWVLGTLGSHITNMYDDFSVNVYPLWLARNHFYSTHEEVNVTHMTKKIGSGLVHFPQLYYAFGDYMKWSEDVMRGSSCVEFEEAVLTEGTFYWQLQPVLHDPMYGVNPHMQSYATQLIARSVPLPDKQSSYKCQTKLILYAKRSGSRKVGNAAEFEKMLDGFATGKIVVKTVELGDLPFHRQVELVRKACVYIYPHGAGGTHVLWLKPGAVAIELYPYGWANPMYRNLAIMTGKTFFAFQARSRPEILNRQADYLVDFGEFQMLLVCAVAIVRNNFADNWEDALAGSPYEVVITDLSVKWACADQ